MTLHDKKIHAKILEHSRIKHIVLFIFNKLKLWKNHLVQKASIVSWVNFYKKAINIFY